MAPVSHDVTFVTSGHDVADARLHRLVASLRTRGLSVQVFGLGSEADAPECAHVRTWKRPGIAARAALAARMASAADGRVLVTLDPDSAVAAGAVVMTSGRVLVVDVHEDYAALLEDRPWAQRAAGVPGVVATGVVRAFESVAKRAELTVVADDHVPPMTARRRLVVRNEPAFALLPEPTQPDAAPRALYIGDARASRGLFAMVEAVVRAPGWHLDVVGPVARADANRLRHAIADGQVADRVHLHGRKPPRQAWEHADGAWCGLALLTDTPAFREALPSKLGEYVACGLPVISTDLPRQREVLHRDGTGVLVPLGDDEAVGASVAAVLRGWSAEPAALEALREQALEVGATARRRRTGYDDFADAIEDLLAPMSAGG